jgi:hypothetical protein
MRTISGVASSRATARRRTARAEWPYDWIEHPRTVRSRLHVESPLGMAAVCLVSLLIIIFAVLPFQFAPFRFALRSLVGMGPPAAQQPLADARVGEIVFTPFDGNACRKVLFYNQTGTFGPEKHFRCFAEVPADRDVTGHVGEDRTNMIKRAFSFPGAR